MFDEIIEIVNNYPKNREQIAALLAGKCIDSRQGNDPLKKSGDPLMTPAAYFAERGEVEKVNLLRRMGANSSAIAYGYAKGNHVKELSEYRSVPSGVIARGFAAAGNHKKVEEYRTKHHANINMIVRGYVQAGNHAMVEEYRTKYKASVNVIASSYAMAGNNDAIVVQYRTQYGASGSSIASSIARGYAMVGNHTNAKDYLIHHKADIDSVANGYAIAGNHAKVEEYHKRGERGERGADANAIARGYSSAGDHEKVEEYRTQHGATVNEIALGYASAGYHEKVEEYRTKQGATSDSIAEGYAIGGDHAKVEEYRTKHGASPESIAKGYKLSGDQEMQKKYDMNFLLDSYLTQRTNVKDSSKKTKEYLHSNLPTLFQKSFTQKNAAVLALKSALNGENVDLNEHLSTLRNGKLGKELRAFVKSGVANTLVDKEVNTVRDFVHALQEKNTAKPQPPTA